MDGAAHPATRGHRGLDGAEPRRIDAQVGWGGAALAAVCALAVGLGAYGLRPPAAPVPAPVDVVVAGVAVTVPSTWLRAGPVPPAAPVERLDLIVPTSELMRTVGVEDAPGDQPVFVTLSRPGGSMDPADRTTLLHARFLSAAVAPGAAGLIRRAFRSGTPYASEDLYLAPPDGRAFAARCFRSAAAANMKAACLAELRQNGLDLQVRFAPVVLPFWEPLGAALRLIGAP